MGMPVFPVIAAYELSALMHFIRQIAVAAKAPQPVGGA